MWHLLRGLVYCSDWPGEVKDWLNRKNLLNKKRRQAELFVAFFQGIFVRGERINNPVALNQNEFPLVSLQFRQLALVCFQLFFESHFSTGAHFIDLKRGGYGDTTKGFLGAQ